MKFIKTVIQKFEVEAESKAEAATGEGRMILNQTVIGEVMDFGAKVTLPKEWPLWAKALKLAAEPEDKGIGDVVARTIGEETSEAFKAFYKKVTGKDCGCAGRQARWNIQYPITH